MRPILVEPFKLLCSILDATKCICHHHTDALRIFLFKYQPGVLQCFLDSGKDKVGHAIRSLCQFAGDIVLGMEIFNFTYKAQWQVPIAITCDWPDCRVSCTNGLPECSLTDAIWGHSPNARNDDTPRRRSKGWSVPVPWCKIA